MSNLKLIAQLQIQGIKHNPESIIEIAENRKKQIIFLETGNSKSGLQHILEQYNTELNTDYECYPLWQYKDNQFINNHAPNTLPLCSETIARLEKWANDYDATLNLEDPISSGFSSQEQEEAFEVEGMNLWHKLREELGADYEITYYSHKFNKIVTESRQAFNTQIQII